MLKKFVTGFVTGTLMLAAVGPMLAATVEVSDNGSDSTNKVKVNESCSQSLYQSNKTNVGVSLSLSGNSGKNKANDNTGGNVSVDTGDVTNAALVSVTGGNNTASGLNCCCGENGDSTEVTVSGNGTESYNKVRVKKTKSSSKTQKSKTKVWVEGDLRGNSGKNKANDNTDGDVEVKTGEVENAAEVVVEAGHNTVE